MSSTLNYQSEGWKTSHLQVSSINQGYEFLPYNSEQGLSNFVSRSEGWADISRQGTTHQTKNTINWDGLVEDVFKKEIGQMAEDMQKKK